MFGRKSNLGNQIAFLCDNKVKTKKIKKDQNEI